MSCINIEWSNVIRREYAHITPPLHPHGPPPTHTTKEDSTTDKKKICKYTSVFPACRVHSYMLEDLAFTCHRVGGDGRWKVEGTWRERTLHVHRSTGAKYLILDVLRRVLVSLIRPSWGLNAATYNLIISIKKKMHINKYHINTCQGKKKL